MDPGPSEVEIGRRADPDLPELRAGVDADVLAHTVAEDVKQMYGDRLRAVVLFGSWAREDSNPESDIDLLIVLDRVESPWEELRRMEPVLWKRSYENDTVLSATPVAEADLLAGRWLLLRRAQAERRRIA